MAHRHKSRAIIDPNAPIGVATCDRCGAIYNRTALRPQPEWAGNTIIVKNLLVCETCLDEPSPAYKTTIVPPDGEPIPNARPEPYSVDEA